jgi:hypothetical protein
MASIESSSRVRRRNKSLKMKTSSSSSLTPLVNKPSKISSSKDIEVERIINRDGFGYFPMIND